MGGAAASVSPQPAIEQTHFRRIVQPEALEARVAGALPQHLNLPLEQLDLLQSSVQLSLDVFVTPLRVRGIRCEAQQQHQYSADDEDSRGGPSLAGKDSWHGETRRPRGVCRS
jgi:hypothetical protein